MNKAKTLPPATLEGAATPLDAAERLRQLWLQGQQPDLDHYLAGAGALAPGQLAAALRVDQAHRWQSGECVRAEAYLQKYPQVQADPDSALDLIYGEFILRERSGERPDVAEYQGRFPEHAGVLKMQIELHQAIQHSMVVPDSPAGHDTDPLAPGASADTIEQPTIPNYEILSQLGRGGMGVIYKARQVGLKRMVALKVILAGIHAAPSERARFRTEAEAAARLCHPNIVQIYEVGAHNGLPYLALEFMERGSLAPCLAGKPLAPRHAAELIETLARAVQAAHDQGIIHRDLKPANVLLATPPPAADSGTAVPAGVVALLGVPKITDFGLAKFHTDDGSQTTSGTILGTPNYMAPEQAEGNTKHVGPAADIYALGAILYEALTGKPPFVGGTLLQTLEMVRSQEPVSPSRSQPNLPRDLVTICLKALAKEPGRRFSSATALADDLRRFQSDLPVKARPVTYWERSWRWCRRNPTVASLSGGLAVVLVVLLVALSVAGLIRAERDNALTQQKRAELAEAVALRAKQEVQIHSHLARAGAFRRSGQVGQRFQCLAELKKALLLQPSEELRQEIRNEALAALVLPDAEVAREWDGWPDGTFSLACDASLKRYARLDVDGGVSVYRLTETGVEDIVRLPPQGPAISGIWMSPDGRHILFVHSTSREDATEWLAVWRVDGTKARPVLKERLTRKLESVAFQPVGSLVAVASDDHAITLYDLDTGNSKRRLVVSGTINHVAFRPDGAELAVAAGNDVCIFSLPLTPTPLPGGERRGGEGEPRLLRHGDKIKVITHLAWHPDGRRLATACDDLKIHLWDVPTAREIMTPWPGHANFGIRLAFNHAGDRLVSSDWFNQTRLWDVASGQVLMTLPGNFGFQFSPDGDLLGYQRSGSKVRLWRLTAGRELRVFRAPGVEGRQFIHAPSLHADGRVLAAISSQGLVFFDLDSGEKLASVPLPQVSYTGLRCFLPGDGWLMSSPLGTLAWPARPDPDQAHVLRVGPPRRLETKGIASASPDGQVIVLAQPDGAILWHRGSANRSLVLGPQRDVRDTAVSPDKRWVVTCSWAADPRSCVQIWDAATGRHEKDLLSQAYSWARFSPDSRWLVTGAFGQGCRLWQTGTWKEVRPYNDALAAFSPDKRTLAINDVFGQIRLVEIETNREVVRLTGPDPLWYHPACFSPDGTRLIAVARDLRAIYVWDLRLLRQQLQELGLDWEGAVFPPLPPPNRPPEVRVDSGYLKPLTDFPDPRHAAAVYSLALALQPLNHEAALQRGLAFGRLKKQQAAIDDYTLFLALTAADDPRRAEVLFRRSNNSLNLGNRAAAINDLLQMATLDLSHLPWPTAVAKRASDIAWACAKKPEPVPSLEQALTLARMALRLEPASVFYKSTVGVLCYRLNRYEDAALALEGNLEDNVDRAAFDLYVLAMVYQRLGQPGKARDAFARAVNWHEQNQARLTEAQPAELSAFRAEAEALLK
jgi:serine/threonine protein kinase/WD40 repeat protein